MRWASCSTKLSGAGNVIHQLERHRHRYPRHDDRLHGWTALKSYIASNSGARVSRSTRRSTRRTRSRIRSGRPLRRGPSIGVFPVNATEKLAVKPELVAPGVGIYTATQKLDPSGQAYHASGYTAVTGTSYAVPIVAGAVAILKQKNPATHGRSVEVTGGQYREPAGPCR